MLFSTTIFLFVFLPLVLAVYYNPVIRSRQFRNVFLLLASIFFYAWGEPFYVLLMLLSIVVNWGLGLLVDRYRAQPGERAALVMTVVYNLGVLFLFKYLNFTVDNLNLLFRTDIRMPQIALPVGISFYTFQTLGYLIDIYRGKIQAERHLGYYALFVTFFPQLIAGPISRAGSLMPQLHENAEFSYEGVTKGLKLMAWGYFKKLVIASSLAVYVDRIYDDLQSYAGFALLVAAVFYSIQIYCDFSGYSDIAIGCAKLFGKDLMINFRSPYFASSIKEFWGRWHISLSTWFRDYLYFPLGGSRKGKARTYINVLIVFALSGLWHGAAMKYVLWGLLFGVFQVIGGLLTPAKQRLCAALHIPWDAGWLQIIRVIITFGLSTFAWIFFRADSALQACAIIKRIVTAAGACFPLNLTHLGLTERALNVLAVSLIGLVLTDIIGDRFPLREKLLETVWLRYAVWVILLAVTAVCGAYGTGFNPQEFVYFQF